jgi:hypothetical protein
LAKALKVRIYMEMQSTKKELGVVNTKIRRYSKELRESKIMS